MNAAQQAPLVLVALEGAGRRQQLRATRLEGGRIVEERSWPAADDRARGEALGAVLDWADAALLASFDLSALGTAVRRLPVTLSGRLLGRIADLRALAFITWPTVPRHAAEPLLRHLTGRRRIPTTPMEQAMALLGLLRQRLAAMDLFVLRDLADRLNTGTWPAAALLMEAVETRRGEPLTAASYSEVPPRVPARRHRPERRGAALDAAALGAELGPDGAVARAMPGYEHRPGQVEMAKAVAEAFNRDEILCVEAGTGVGKSLAYLLPAARWALAAQERVVIGTHTKSLQDQLIGNDIPLLQKALDRPLATVAIKGRNNYACGRRLLARARETEASLFELERVAIAYLLSWFVESDTGELDEIGGEVREALPGLDAIVNQIRSDSLTCLGRACPWRGACAVERVRRRAENADLVVANHALIMADIGAQVLPEYERLILDEAHHLEDVATDQFGLEFSRRGAQSLLRSLVGAQERGGLVPTVARQLEGARPEDRAAALLTLTSGLEGVARVVESQLEVVSAHVESFLFGHRVERSAVPATRRLTEDVLLGERWQGAAQALRLIQGAITAVGSRLAELAAGIADLDAQSLTDAEGLTRDVAGAAVAWQSLGAALASIVNGSVEGTVAWVEGSVVGRGVSWAIRVAPVDVGPSLQAALYDTKRTIVMTSATLTVDRQFDFLVERVGLGPVQGKTVTLSVPSPFAYERQLLLCVPQDLPSPRTERYQDALCEGVLRLAQVTGGGMLVLFTSRTAMLDTYERLKGDFRRAGIELLSQEVSGPRSDLLGRLRANEGTVLFGLKSFWEGVDVPGQALRCVVVAKLPFAVPSDPLIEARREHLDALGRDGQNDFYVPLAVMSFRQGVGRLIRTREDRGTVFVMDARLLTRSYGQRFLHSIERPALMAAPFDRCLAAAEGWLTHADPEPSPPAPLPGGEGNGTRKGAQSSRAADR